jgi:hypothetical protein
VKFLFSLIVLLLLVEPLSVQVPSAFCRGVLDESVILEVSVTGRGMIWPNLFTQIFFRLRKDGLVVYDARTTSGVVRRSFTLNENELAKLVSLLNARDLSRSSTDYPMLQSMRDAVLKSFSVSSAVPLITTHIGVATGRLTSLKTRHQLRSPNI